MLSKDRLEEIANEFKRVIYPAEVGEMARELLSLQSLPEMTEVDAMEVMFGGCVIADQRIHFESACELARRSIASAQAERQRADEADAEIEQLKEFNSLSDEFVGLLDERQKEQIAALTAELDQIISDLLEVFSGEWCALQELKTMARMDRLTCFGPATRILELCDGGRDDTNETGGAE